MDKRVRPILSLLTYNMITGEEDFEKVLPFACAIELIHTYSLIHDDLPAMDDDDIRRGKPTNHKVYSEAIAILAGDGLLNMATEVISRELENYTDIDDVKKAIKALKYIFTASGVHGMIGGQVIDMVYTENMNQDICEAMYKLKTAALIKASVVSAALLAGANDDVIATLEEYSNCIGIAYQMRDDVLDKDKDLQNDTNTMLKYKSVDEINERIEELTQRAQAQLDSLEFDTSQLSEFADLLMNRGI